MISRERILDAASRVYAQHGFRGATTRLIAIEAGVNEVTLFRTFGSKSALLEAVLMHSMCDVAQPTLPVQPRDPLAEITTFVRGSLARIQAMRPLLIQTMGELNDRPEAAEFACRGRHHVHDTITTYIRTLQDLGIADPGADVDGAAVMLTGTVISDVMGRPIVPDIYPPIDEVAGRYAVLFLRAIGVTLPASAQQAGSHLTMSSS